MPKKCCWFSNVKHVLARISIIFNNDYNLQLEYTFMIPSDILHFRLLHFNQIQLRNTIMKQSIFSQQFMKLWFNQVAVA